MEKLLKVLEKIFIMFLIYSFLGWMYEELWYLLILHKIVNRGLLFGPYLPIYGIGILIIYWILWDFIHKEHKILHINITVLLAFIFIFLISTIVEYISHYLLDNLFNIQLWDYSNKSMNINGRVCLLTSIYFSIGGVIALYFIQPTIEKINKVLTGRKRHIIVLIFFFLIMIDLIATIFTKMK